MTDESIPKIINNQGHQSSDDPITKSWVTFEDETELSKEKSNDNKTDNNKSNLKIILDKPAPKLKVPSPLKIENNGGGGGGAGSGTGPAVVVPTETIQINLERSISITTADSTQQQQQSLSGTNSHGIGTVSSSDTKSSLRNVELPIATIEPIRQGFSNGDIIVTLLPINSRFPWITPAIFRPELVPEELMAQGLTLTVEEYVQALELLVNDVRFTLYNICYKRILVVWITLAFIVLLSLLFSGTNGLTLFGLGIGWLVLNAGAIFLSMYIKFKLQRNLEKCLAHVNKHLLRHKIILALDDRGKISCHKVNLCFIYMDSAPCIAHLQNSIDHQERNPTSGWEERMDITANDIVIQGNRTTRLSRKQDRSVHLYLRYIQRWGKDFLRRRLDWTVDDVIANPANPKHVQSSLCPCQYIEDILTDKMPPLDENRDCCPERATLLYLRYISRWGRNRIRGLLASPPALGGRHCSTLTCPCQFIDEHIQCKPQGKLTLKSFFYLPDQINAFSSNNHNNGNASSTVSRSPPSGGIRRKLGCIG